MSIRRICQIIRNGCQSVLRELAAQRQVKASPHSGQILALGLTCPNELHHQAGAGNNEPHPVKSNRSLLSGRRLTGGHASRPSPSGRICG